MKDRKRRDFAKLLPYFLAGAFLYPASGFIFFQQKEDRKVTLPLRELKDGVTYLKKVGYYIYKDKKDISVYDAHCTHMGCIINFSSKKDIFECPCHKSRFTKKGKLLRGPAKRDLDTIAFKIKDKTLYIG